MAGKAKTASFLRAFDQAVALKIQDYAIIGNYRAAALIGCDGSLDWLCWPDWKAPQYLHACWTPTEAKAGLLLKSDEIKNATDGELEWFLRQGDLRKGMPSWSSLPQAQRWQVVAYLRSLQH